MIIQSDQIKLVISTLPEETLQHFIAGIFRNREFILGDRISSAGFRINSIEAMPSPVFKDEMSFHALFPIFVSNNVKGQKYANIMRPNMKDI